MFDQKMSLEQSQLRESRVIKKLKEQETKNIKIESVDEVENDDEEVLTEESKKEEKQEN